ncbi:MAG: hypothetical protein HQK51_10555 [Oligoflexia bacterium]|nr:hypothetical protein [Oligoflexia bacterium]
MELASPKNLNEIVKESLWKILEQHAFLFLDPLPEDDIMSYLKQLKVEGNFQDKDYLCVKMNFECNNREGSFFLYMSADSAIEIETNLLGNDIDQIDLVQCIREGDGAKEILNIMGANILTEIYGEEPKRNLSIPESIEVNFTEVIKQIQDYKKNSQKDTEKFLTVMLTNQFPIILQLIFYR